MGNNSIMNKSYLLGGKLGDTIHSLVIPSYIYSQTGEKADLYLSTHGDGFTTGIYNTFLELAPMVLAQPFVSSFQIYHGERIDVRLYEFRNSPKLFNRAWTDVYFSTFLPDIDPPKDFAWIVNPIEQFEGVIVNRSIRPWGEYTNSRWWDLLEEHLGNIKFLCTDIAQWEKFPLKALVPPLVTHHLQETFNAINSCKLFIGNQSSPLAYASSINKPRIAELRQNPDAPHYRHEDEYSSNITWFIGD